MSLLVSAQGLGKAFSHRTLFKQLSFSILSGQKIALIGPNGAGKSTLLKILMGDESPDEGQIAFQKNLRVAYLEQVPRFTQEATLLSSVTEGSHGDQSAAQALIAKTRLIKLESQNLDLQTQISTLSGGTQKKIALLRELAREPDLLLLDEPTNHLDLESIDWLQAQINNYPGAVLTVTHDRTFLDQIADQIWELDRRHKDGVLRVNGHYLDYLDVRQNLIAENESRELSLKNTYRRELEWLRQGAKARTTKQKARIDRALDLAQDLREQKERNFNQKIEIQFQSDGTVSKRLIEAQKISYQILADPLNPRTLFKDLELFLGPGKRLGLLGQNGAGKSTLIKVLTGQLQPSSGQLIRHTDLSYALFEQNRESLDPEASLLKTLCPVGDHVLFQGQRVHIRSYLDRFLFDPGSADMKIKSLSGGEKSRVLLAKLMLSPAPLLILDEPTNDLDLPTLSVLESCLIQFEGAVLIVSHDRTFLQKVCNQFLAIHTLKGQWQSNPTYSSLEQYDHGIEQILKQAEGAQNTKGTEPKTLQKPETKKKLSFNQKRELDLMESVILETENKLAQAQSDLETPETLSDPKKLALTSKEVHDLSQKVDELYARWTYLSEIENS